MQEKLQKLFKEINLEEELLPYFNNAKIEKIVIYTHPSVKLLNIDDRFELKTI